MQLPELRYQPCHRKLHAERLIERGADAALILFWLNLITGLYSHLPMPQVMAEVMHYIERDPAFEDDIINWFLTFEDITKNPC